MLIEINRAAGLGMVDRALTPLIDSGTLDDITGSRWERSTASRGSRPRLGVLDVLRDRLTALDVPVLAGLPLGHLANPATVPLGVACELDADAGALRCAAALR